LVMMLPFDGMPKPVTFYQAVVRTGHQTNGALLLAATVVFTLRSFREFAGSLSQSSPELDGVAPRHSERAAREWEVVA
jgi:cytochrome c oxidase assembly protein subunit 15